MSLPNLKVALTLWLAGASARVGEDPYRRFRKEYGKGLPIEAEEQVEDDDADEDESDEDEQNDDSGKTKETSVHRKHFMDQYFLHSGPVQYEFGHVCEDPSDWEQRYEKRDFDKNRHQGQVKWGDAKGGQGEHYWDFNHDGNIEDEEPEWFQEPRQKGFQGKYPDGSVNYDGRSADGNKARGIIKEKLTITKKKNGRTVDQTKINMEKLADIGDIIQKHDPKPFAGDKSLIEEFNRKTQGFKKKDFDSLGSHDSDDPNDYFPFNEDIRRMGTLPLDDKAAKTDKSLKEGDNSPKTKKVAIEELKEVQRRYDVFPKMITKELKATSDKDKNPVTAESVSKATINIDADGTAHFDPITGSLTDSKTGRKFKIFGVLVDS